MSPTFNWVLKRTARMKEVRQKLDHAAIRLAAREILDSTGPLSMFPVAKNEIPEAIAKSNPARVNVHEGRVFIEYGDGHGHFGLQINSPGIPPPDGERIIEGVYYYEFE